MAKKLYDLCIKGREYTDRNGNTKNAWENIGSVMQGDRGPYMFLKRTFNPAGVEVENGRESILVSMFEPKQQNGNSAPAETMQTPDGASWTRQDNGNWTKDVPAGDPTGNFTFANGPDGAGMTPDIPF